MSGYRTGDSSYFFIFFAVNVLNQFVNVTFAMWCVSIRRNFAEASLIANASLTFISLSCGYFIQAASLPVYVRWIKYISYVYWGFAALSSNGISLQMLNLIQNSITISSIVPPEIRMIPRARHIPETLSWISLEFLETMLPQDALHLSASSCFTSLQPFSYCNSFLYA
jgi:hypothetical protein